MLVARFDEGAGSAGKEVLWGGNGFTLEGHGQLLSASDVMAYDAAGHLLWAGDWVKTWVDSLAQAEAGRRPAAAAAAGARASEAGIVVRQCPGCRRVLASDAAFCSRCGEPMDERTRAPVTATQRQLPLRSDAGDQNDAATPLIGGGLRLGIIFVVIGFTWLVATGLGEGGWWVQVFAIATGFVTGGIIQAINESHQRRP